MSVIKRGSSRFWYVQFQMGGETYIKSAKTTDRKVAEIMESDWRRQLIHQKVMGTKDRITVGDAIDLYSESKRDMASHSNIVRQGKVVTTFFGRQRWLDELVTADIERLKIDRQRVGYSAQTIKHTFNVLRGAWKYARRTGFQVSEIEFPSIRVSRGRLRYLTFEEERQLLKALDPRREVKGLATYHDRTPELRRQMQDMYDFVVLLIDTGARYSELATLEWRRINLTERSIQLWRSKVRNESILFMTDRVAEVLNRRNREQHCEFVFTNKKGEQRGYSVVGLRKAFKSAGLSDCSAHTLRHTHATRLIQNGLSLYEVKEILGHADIKTTMRYAHIEQRSVSVKAREVINRLNKEQQTPHLRVVA